MTETTEIVAAKTFQERMFERIRDQMGELMTEEDLKTIVDTAVQKAFFEPQKAKDQYGYIHEIESVFVVMIREQMSARVKVALQEWLKEHPDIVTKTLDDALAKGMFGLIRQYVENAIQSPMNQLATQLQANLKR